MIKKIIKYNESDKICIISLATSLNGSEQTFLLSGIKDRISQNEKTHLHCASYCCILYLYLSDMRALRFCCGSLYLAFSPARCDLIVKKKNLVSEYKKVTSYDETFFFTIYFIAFRFMLALCLRFN